MNAAQVMNEGVFRCPHCSGALPESVRSTATRCPTCRLVVGAGRGVPDDRPDTVSAGTNAGVKASAARRADLPPINPGTVIAALNRMIDETGSPSLRLRMVDYDALAARHPDDYPSLAQVLATFGSWKQARAAAARTRRNPDPE